MLPMRIQAEVKGYLYRLEKDVSAELRLLTLSVEFGTIEMSRFYAELSKLLASTAHKEGNDHNHKG